MFRDGDIIGIRTRVSDLKDRKTVNFIRQEKGSEELKNLRNRIKSLEKSINIKTSTIERFESGKATTSIDEFIKKHKDVNAHLNHLKECIKQETKELEETKNKLYELQKTNQVCHKTLKRKIKKRSNTWIKEQILTILKEDTKEEIPYLMKEDIARILEVKECQVEQVFMELNREGYLSKAIHKAPHDSQRDPHGFIGNMMWMGDIYEIRKRP